jgi:hypothetical protein
MNDHPQPTVPVEPLVDYLAHRYGTARGITPAPDYNMAAVCDLLDVPRDTWYRWKRRGIPLWTADRIAIDLSVHPIQIWDSFWDGTEEEAA